MSHQPNPQSPRPIRTLLIANRGEIALRVMRTAARMGIHTVAIHTDLDLDAPHVHAADDATAVASYLDVDAVVAAAKAAGADAVHPGYGFLSERAALARALEAAGITLVGPSAEVMDAMGRKDAAREVALAAGVPVVPRGEPTDPTAYPVLVKAAAGGGGKGMRIVRDPADLEEARAAAAREARSAFGDDTLLVERYVERGRHLEVQVIGDAHGTVLHLGERDCSAQRRHQKVLEEAPAPRLDEETRARLRQAGVDLAAHVGYTGAGTVEFLLDEATGEFYFLEMNTRLQVEHPVTEAVTGLDLVELQLRVAEGEPLPLAQADVRFDGHAIEARVYAEDAFGGFLPQAGTATHVVWPDDLVRVDHALADGQVVSTAYDPMLGKVIAHGADREAARQLLVEALDHTAVTGLTTNAGFLRALVDSAEFRDAAVDTAWLDRHEVPRPDDAAARALAGIALQRALDEEPRGPWQPDGFRLGGVRGPLIEHGHDLSFHGWCAPPAGTAGLQRVGSFQHGDGWVLRGRHATEVVWHGQRFVLAEDDAAHRGAAVADGIVLAPMPGTVLEVSVAVGDEVAEGQALGMMEAMKMELTLRAPFAGTVASLDAVVGTQVPLGTPLFHVEPEGQEGAP
ncbi:biotin carboxylase N-terminal domain-containing protein [Nocardioides sp. zg-DK7169]|uniref:acetyl/propionyl/methylcrotonyl-CoA carboxylase subunit alpha n=1 Tax=Nocardioides sp. zg-DK7169 TaxID=2736600 RepID=UPI00155690A8|nr:biotin carboxylase N-terminal domain-containing protein [Nocardioides sp. zg-DK7169]NPC98105.1 ATP-grasp domain-containing protein [Nocardioides sp. zg-DK7169]